MLTFIYLRHYFNDKNKLTRPFYYILYRFFKKKPKNKTKQNKKLNLVVYLVNIDYVVNEVFWYNMIKIRTKLINKITFYGSTIYDLSYWEQIRIDHFLSNFYNGPTIWRKKNKIEKCIFHNKLHFHYYLNITFIKKVYLL